MTLLIKSRYPKNRHPTWPVIQWLGVILIISTLATAEIQAETASKIKKIAPSELGQIINHKDSRSLMVFMAAWCRPCKKALPIINRLYHQFQNQGLRFIGISIDSGGPEAMERVLKKKQVDFPVFWVGESAVEEYKLVGIPMIFLIKNGQIVEKIPGKCSYEFLRGQILELSK